MQILFVIIVFALLYFLRLLGLLSKDYRRDLIVFTFLMLIAFLFSLLAVLGVNLVDGSSKA
ncbi:MAG TPA: hypothetical protein DDW65_21020 [Firmicutes bacterium]|jgi:hypothetical protein|nr:hypothetical protein [Bacillota bacterium]